MIDVEAIRRRWAPAFNGYVDLSKVEHETLREKLEGALGDLHEALREIETLRRGRDTLPAPEPTS